MYGVGYVVTSDLYSIADRLKEIDDGYFIYYSYKNRRYEVHNRNQRGRTLSLVLPYKRLDERTIRLVRQTRSERASSLISQMEEENARIERERMKQLVKNKQNELENALIQLTKPKKGGLDNDL
ncbi:MAG: hypothetical protein E7353_07955 [Clostridiales bacterium]|nr:hypothetical protein [Clostridiales bacterium]